MHEGSHRAQSKAVLHMTTERSDQRAVGPITAVGLGMLIGPTAEEAPRCLAQLLLCF